MPWGQVVVGPPGSGKSTYCAALARRLAGQGRTVAVVNLDPATDGLPYSAAIDVTDLVDLAAVQAETGLGPNGGLIWAMEYLESNVDWLIEKLEPLLKQNCYLVFDCPGQVELFELHQGFKRILASLESKCHIRLVVAQLVDAHLCADGGKYMAALLLCLSTMLHLELPQVGGWGVEGGCVDAIVLEVCDHGPCSPCFPDSPSHRELCALKAHTHACLLHGWPGC